MTRDQRPLDRRIDRVLAANDRGPVFTFDIDKTYLDTRFQQLRDLLRVPLELAIDKRPFPGVAELIRACQRGTETWGHDRPTFFVSASPKQMRSVLERRMVLDGITVDGITLKDWGYYLRQLRPARLRHQIFYKLLALLTNRAELPIHAKEVLFGDDSESDPIIYTMYSAIVARRLAGHALERLLEIYEVERSEQQRLLEVSDALDGLLDDTRDTLVRRIFIHAITKRPEPPVFAQGVRPIFYDHALLPAAYLAADGFVRLDGLRPIFAALRRDNAFIAGDALDAVGEVLEPVHPEWRRAVTGNP